MTHNPDPGILVVDVKLSGRGGNLRFANSPRPKSATDALEGAKFHPSVQSRIMAARSRDPLAGVHELNISCQGPTFIVFTCSNTNWSFDPIRPISIDGGLCDCSDEFVLHRAANKADLFVLENKFTTYGHWKYSLFVDIAYGRGSSAGVTRIIIDPDMDNEDMGPPK